MNRINSNKYSGQALAIVLVVLVVAVIIALALLSRSLSDSRQVVQEQASAEALEIADTFLDSVATVKYSDISAAAQDGDFQGCISDVSNPGTYDFASDGCTLDGFDEVEGFLEEVEDVVAGGTFVSDPFVGAIKYGLQEQCNTEDDRSIRVTMEPLDEDDSIEVKKDDTIGFVTKGVDAPAGCQVSVYGTPTSGGGGMVVSKIYANPLAADPDRIESFKDFDTSDSTGYCVNCSGTGWDGWTIVNNAENLMEDVNYRSNPYNLYELRLRAVGSDFEVRLESSPAGCFPREEMIRVRSEVNCSGVSRGREFTITDGQWAPSIFDYVLFNGDGTLEHL